MPEAVAVTTLGDQLTALGLALLTALNAWPHVRKRLGIGGVSDEPGVSRYDDTAVRASIEAVRAALIEQGEAFATLHAEAGRLRADLDAHRDADDAEFRRISESVHAVDKALAELGATCRATLGVGDGDSRPRSGSFRAPKTR